MKKIILAIILIPSSVFAGEYAIPACYEHTPTKCSFNEMTLELCNVEAKGKKVVFAISEREYAPGGNKFMSKNGDFVCLVKPVKGSEPTKYSVTISKK
jgi:hypothetical protein